MSITKNGRYLVTPDTQNGPDSTGTYFVYVVNLINGIMIIDAYGNMGQAYYSGIIRNGGVTWKRIDNFGCSTLAELKAALANV